MARGPALAAARVRRRRRVTAERRRGRKTARRRGLRREPGTRTEVGLHQELRHGRVRAARREGVHPRRGRGWRVWHNSRGGRVITTGMCYPALAKHGNGPDLAGQQGCKYQPKAEAYPFYHAAFHKTPKPD